MTAAEAEAQLNVVGARRAAERPNDYPPGFRFGIIPVVDWVVREFRGTLWMGSLTGGSVATLRL